jgi:hypothetical protein
MIRGEGIMVFRGSMALLTAVLLIEDGQGEDPEFLELSRAEATAFTLSEGGSAAVALKLPKKR